MINPLAHIESTVGDLPQTRRGIERRTALLISATGLFLEHGYDAVSLDDIVQHAGGSKASIYKYFGNKDGLFTAICDYRREILFKDLCQSCNSEAFDLKAFLINTLFNFYNHIKIPENVAFIRLVIEQSQKNSQLAKYIHEKGPKEIQLTIAEALKKADEDGIITCREPFNSAQFFFGILRNLEWRCIMGIPLDESDQETSNYIHYSVERFIDGHQKV